MNVKPSLKDIDLVLLKAYEGIDAGESKVPGESYEQGLADGIEWLLGHNDDEPLEEH
jgi:hypothetical protein